MPYVRTNRFLRFLGISLLLHIIPVAYFSIDRAGKKPVEFRVQGGRTHRMSLRVVASLGERRPQRQKPQKKGSQEDRGSTAGRFRSDVLRQETSSIFSSIVYPREARRRNWQGLVSIEAEIRPDGRVDRARIVQSSGHRVLDRAALNGVLRHTFRQGSETETILLHFRFRLRD